MIITQSIRTKTLKAIEVKPSVLVVEECSDCEMIGFVGADKPGLWWCKRCNVSGVHDDKKA